MTETLQDTSCPGPRPGAQIRRVSVSARVPVLEYRVPIYLDLQIRQDPRDDMRQLQFTLKYSVVDDIRKRTIECSSDCIDKLNK